MTKTMDQNLFDMMAYGSASVYIKEKGTKEVAAGEYNKFVEKMSVHYGKTFDGDNFGSQVKEIVPKLDAALKKYEGFSDPAERRKAFELYFELAQKFNPDGTKVKKFLGLFGGLKFAKSHMDTRVRPNICLENLTNYFSLR